MTNISDVELMAYADGVLPRQLRPLVRQALLRDPALLEKLESYIITHRGLAAPFARLPLPDRPLQHLDGAKLGRSGQRWWFVAWRAVEEKAADHWRRPAWSLAGLAALVGATVLAWQLSVAPRVQPQPAELAAKGLMTSGQLQRALDGTESNVSATLATLTPTGTFLSHAKAWCRQYELGQDGEGRLAGIACRDRGGAWRVMSLAVLGPTLEASGYAPAAKEPQEGEDGSGGVEAALGKLMRDVILLPADERRLIAGGWPLPDCANNLSGANAHAQGCSPF
jgi:hypothetical protein